MSHAPVNATELSCAEYTEELTQFRMGLLDEADTEVAQQHLYACPDCRLFTHQVETVTDLVADAEPHDLPHLPDSVSLLLHDIVDGEAERPSDPSEITRLLFGLARSLAPHAAEDLVQETLLSAFEESPRGLDPLSLARDLADRAFAEPEPMVRSLGDYRTRAENQTAELDPDADTAEFFYPDFYDIGPDAGRHIDAPNRWGQTNTLSPDDEVFTTDLYRVVDGAIARLADPLGQLVQLVDINDVSLADAAYVLRLDKVDAVDALHRARIHLRGVVNEYMAVRA